VKFQDVRNRHQDKYNIGDDVGYRRSLIELLLVNAPRRERKGDVPASCYGFTSKDHTDELERYQYDMLGVK